MKIILLKDIPKIGKKNEVKEVADGYALNFVIPRGLGVRATESGVQKVVAMKSATEAERKIQEDLLVKSLANLSTLTVTVTGKTNDKGHLFAGIDAVKLAQEIEKQTDMRFDAESIELEKPIKEVGEYVITVSAHGKKGKVKVVVEGVK